MFDPQNLNDLTKKFIKSLPPTLQGVSDEIEQSFKIWLKQMFNDMNLVTRETFDVQSKILEKTRLKLDELSQKVEILEKKLSSNDKDNK